MRARVTLDDSRPVGVCSLPAVAEGGTGLFDAPRIRSRPRPAVSISDLTEAIRLGWDFVAQAGGDVGVGFRVAPNSADARERLAGHKKRMMPVSRASLAPRHDDSQNRLAATSDPVWRIV